MFVLCNINFGAGYYYCGDPLLHVTEREGVRKCQFRDDDDCLFYFTYQYMPDGQVHIKVQQTKGLCAFRNIKAPETETVVT